MKKYSKRINNAYKNYVKRYKAKQESMRRRGMEMESSIMNKNLYVKVREEMKENGVKENINQTIVSEQQYRYSYKTAKRFLETAEQEQLEWGDSLVREIRSGKIDVTGINDYLKEHTDFTGKERAAWIGHNIFGSE